MKEINLFKVHTPPNIGKVLQKVFDEGMISEGKYSDLFEQKIANFIETKNLSLVNSGTSALSLSYHLCDLKEGDEVITTPMTCMATNEPIELSGAKIVWADIDPTTGNISPQSVKNRITDKTKAIVGVHWAGQPFEIDKINSIAKSAGVKVIEDAAHALGAKYNGVKIGNHSDYVCFSFQAIKHLTTGDGGAITCKTEEENQRIKKLRWFGLNRKFVGSKWEQDITESGFKYHMNNLNASIGLEQLKYIDSIITRHVNNGKYYDENIDNPNIELLRRSKNIDSSYWIYTLLVDDRKSFIKHMAKNKIQTDVVHVRNDNYSVFGEFKRQDLPGCDQFCSKMINIPVGWWLTKEDRNRIIDAVNKFKK